MAGRTQTYYDNNPKARKVKKKYQKKYDASPLQIKKRAKLVKLNRKKGTKGDGLDISHKKDGSTVLERASKNRARNRSKK